MSNEEKNRTGIYVQTSVGATTTGGPSSSDVAGNRSPVAGNTMTTRRTTKDDATDKTVTASCSTDAQSKPMLRKRNGSDKKWLRKCRAAGMSEKEVSELLRKRLEVPPRDPKGASRQLAIRDTDGGGTGGIADKVRRPTGRVTPERLEKARRLAKTKSEPATSKEGVQKKPETTGKAKGTSSTRKVVEGTKRNRSEDITPPVPKRPKTGKQPTFKEVVCESLKVAIIDKSHSEGKIAVLKNQQALAAKFEEWQVDALREDTDFVPRFHWSGFFNDHFRVTCVDMRTLDFLKCKVANEVALWDGANLEVVGKDDVPKLKKISIWLPGEFREAREILSFMDRLNRDF